MSDQAERFTKAVTELEALTGELTADEARRSFDDATLQVFWREWPDISSWAGALWRKLNEDLAQPASPPRDPDLDETGEGGGG